MTKQAYGGGGRVFMSRINYTITLLALLACLAFPVVSSGDVFFYDDYDAPGDTNWTCADGVRSGYTDQSGCPSPSSYGDVTHYAGEISPGGRTGNSLKMWRRNGIWTDYLGYLDKDFTSTEFNNNYKELYVRWYVKIPAGWDANLGDATTMKLNRFYFGSTAGAKTEEWYMDVKGSTFKNGRFSFANTAEGNAYYSQKTVAQLGVNDGNWHSLEWHVKLNSTTGSADGALNFYIDGVQQYIVDGLGQNPTFGKTKNMGAATNHYFTSALPPAIGNLSGGAWNFPTNGWYAIEFDDYAVGASYIGPSDYEPTCEDTPGLCESQNDCESAGWFWCDGACQTTPCQVEDTTPPSVTITTSAQTVSTSSVSISFTASDNIGVTSRKWRIGSSPDATHGTDCTSPATATGLSVGQNTVYIGAGDAAGNWGSDSITVNYSPVATTISIINSGIRGGGGVR